MSKDYAYIIDILANGTQEQLEELSEILDGFPDGRDNFIFNHWIINAIDCGSKLSNDIAALKLLVKYGTDLSIKTRIDDYATPLEEARILNCEEAAKYLESVNTPYPPIFPEDR